MTREAFLTVSLVAQQGSLLHPLVFPSSYVSTNPSTEQDSAVSPTRSPVSFLLQEESDFYFREWADAVRSETNIVLSRNQSLAGPLVRLAFHDAITLEYDRNVMTVSDRAMKKRKLVGGPNGSIRYELDWSENRGLSMPLKIVQEIYDQTVFPEMHGNQPQSLADTVALVAAEAIEYAGGPQIPIRLGRLDVDIKDPRHLKSSMKSLTRRSVVTGTMPDAGLDSDGLRNYFTTRLGFTEEEFVALSGVHGMGRHVSMLGMTKDCLRNLTRTCLEEAPVLLPFVTASVDKFDNGYFQALLRWNDQKIELGEAAFIPTDVALVVDPRLQRHVERFACSQELYYRVFRTAFQKLVDPTATTRKRY